MQATGCAQAWLFLLGREQQMSRTHDGKGGSPEGLVCVQLVQGEMVTWKEDALQEQQSLSSQQQKPQVFPQPCWSCFTASSSKAR